MEKKFIKFYIFLIIVTVFVIPFFVGSISNGASTYFTINSTKNETAWKDNENNNVYNLYPKKSNTQKEIEAYYTLCKGKKWNDRAKYKANLLNEFELLDVFTLRKKFDNSHENKYTAALLYILLGGNYENGYSNGNGTRQQALWKLLYESNYLRKFLGVPKGKNQTLEGDAEKLYNDALIFGEKKYYDDAYYIFDLDGINEGGTASGKINLPIQKIKKVIISYYEGETCKEMAWRDDDFYDEEIDTSSYDPNDEYLPWNDSVISFYSDSSCVNKINIVDIPTKGEEFYFKMGNNFRLGTIDFEAYEYVWAQPYEEYGALSVFRVNNGDYVLKVKGDKTWGLSYEGGECTDLNRDEEEFDNDEEENEDEEDDANDLDDLDESSGDEEAGGTTQEDEIEFAKIKIEQKIINVKLIVQNGDAVVQGNPEDNIEHLTDLDGIKDSGSKYAKIEIDSKLLYGSELKIEYKMTLSNISDDEFVTVDNIIATVANQIKYEQTEIDIENIDNKKIYLTSIDNGIMMSGWGEIKQGEPLTIKYEISRLLSADEDLQIDNSAKADNVVSENQAVTFVLTPPTGGKMRFRPFFINLIDKLYSGIDILDKKKFEEEVAV